MSTRSGKRIHISESENIDSNLELQRVRETRSKRQKENCDEVITENKKKNFVRRPSDDEVENSNDKTELPTKSARKSRRHTLKELNTVEIESEVTNDKKSMRQSRRIRNGDAKQMDVLMKEVVSSKEKKKLKNQKTLAPRNSENEQEVVLKKKTNKKKKRSSNSFIIEDLANVEDNKNLNNVSVDSFHSAAGSPDKNTFDYEANNKDRGNRKREKKINSSTSTYNTVDNDKIIKKKIKKIEKEKIKKSSLPKKSFETTNNKVDAINTNNEASFETNVSEVLEIKSKKKNSKEYHSSNSDGVADDDQNKQLEHKFKEVLNSSIITSTQNSRKSVGKSDDVDNVSLDPMINVLQANGINKNKEDKSNPNISKKRRNSSCIVSSSGSRDATYDKINVSDINISNRFDKHDNLNKESNMEKEPLNNSRSSKRKSSIQNIIYDKVEGKCLDLNTTFEKEMPSNINKSIGSVGSSRKLLEENVSIVLNGTYDKNTDNTSILNNTFNNPNLDATFECTTFKRGTNIRPTSSILCSDNTDNMTSDVSEDCSRISITSDDSRTEHIINTTLILIESSMDDSQMDCSKTNKTVTPLKDEANEVKSTPDKLFLMEDNKTPLKRDGTYTDFHKTPLKREGTFTEKRKPEASVTPMTPLKREGTFTKDSPITSPKVVDKTPTRRKSMPSPGRTPFSSSKNSSKEKSILNITHSIEKPHRRSSMAAVPPRLTKVMFCSPVSNPAASTLVKGKVIKSNLKGSNKSFVFDDSVSESSSVSRKRSLTQGCEAGGAKRARLASTPHARTRTTSAAARLQDPGTPKKDATPSKCKPPRTKLPNFAALHQKQFDKMESLDECQERKAKRARQFLTPNTSTHMERTGPEETTNAVETIKKPPTPKSKEIERKSHNYTRFGFKLNVDVNPFSIPPKTGDKPKDNIVKQGGLKRQPTLPSLAGSTLRKEVAKQTVMREKSFTDKRDANRKENRTVIKGVRTNRRFELQMKMRNID